jgi:hypothetical protein
MNTFTITCVCFDDLCGHLGIDSGDARLTISNSDISFGTNDDTLVSLPRVCRTLGVEIPTVLDPSVMVSLGT